MQKTPKGTIIYDKGESIVREGETGKTIYFLVSGKVGVYKGDDLIEVIENPNSPIGEISAILGIGRTATCVALERSEVVAYKGGIDEIVEKYPKTAKAIIVSLAERVARSVERFVRRENVQKEKEKKDRTSEVMSREESIGSERKNVFLHILEFPPEKINKLLSLLSEKELAVILSKTDNSFKDRLSKFISSRKMQAIEDLVAYYSKNSISSAEMKMLEEKVCDIILAFREEEERQ